MFQNLFPRNQTCDNWLTWVLIIKMPLFTEIKKKVIKGTKALSTWRHVYYVFRQLMTLDEIKMSWPIFFGNIFCYFLLCLFIQSFMKSISKRFGGFQKIPGIETQTFWRNGLRKKKRHHKPENHNAAITLLPL